MRKSLFVLLLILGSFGCASKIDRIRYSHPIQTWPQTASKQEVSVHKTKYTKFMNQVGDANTVILCVGDSITEGLPEDNYPTLLNEMLGEDYAIFNYGASGTTATVESLTPYTATQQYTDSLEAIDPDYLILMFGTNDTNTTTWIDSNHFKESFESLLNTYQSIYPNTQIILCTIVCAYETDDIQDGIANYTIQPQFVNDVNQVVVDLAQKYELSVIDLNTLTTNHLDWYDGDGIHPNSVGKRMIADTIAQWLNQNKR